MAPADAILAVGHLIGEHAHHLDQHHAHIGFQAIQPKWITLRKQIQTGAAKGQKITRRVIDREIDIIFGEGGQLIRRTIQAAGTVRLEAEDFGGKVGVDAPGTAGSRMVNLWSAKELGRMTLRRMTVRPSTTAK